MSLVRDQCLELLRRRRRAAGLRFLFGVLRDGNLRKLRRSRFVLVLGIGLPPRPAGESDDFVIPPGWDDGYSDESRGVMYAWTEPADMQRAHFI
jgi:hypothetical protein